MSYSKVFAKVKCHNKMSSPEDLEEVLGQVEGVSKDLLSVPFKNP